MRGVGAGVVVVASVREFGRTTSGLNLPLVDGRLVLLEAGAVVEGSSVVVVAGGLVTSFSVFPFESLSDLDSGS